MANLYTSGRFQGLDSAGIPLSGGQLFTYSAGTLTAKATYTTQAGTVANANPVVLDSAGRASVWLDGGTYRMILKTATGVTITDDDNISKAGDSQQINVRDFGAVLDGETDDLAAFNLAIASIPSGESREILVDGIAYLSAATTNGGRIPDWIFPPGCGIAATPGSGVGGEIHVLQHQIDDIVLQQR